MIFRSPIRVASCITVDCLVVVGAAANVAVVVANPIGWFGDHEPIAIRFNYVFHVKVLARAQLNGNPTCRFKAIFAVTFDIVAPGKRLFNAAGYSPA